LALEVKFDPLFLFVFPAAPSRFHQSVIFNWTGMKLAPNVHETIKKKKEKKKIHEITE